MVASRSLVACIVTCLGIAWAMPVPETVQVDGDGLAGVWKLASPEWAVVSLLGKVTFGPLQERYCRMERAREGFAIHCLGWDFKSFHGEGKLAGNNVHLAGGFMLLRFVFDGELKNSSSFVGSFGTKIFGIHVVDPDQVTASKLTFTPDAPDTVGFGKALADSLTEIANAPPDAPLGPAAFKRGDLNRESLTPRLLGSLGRIEAVVYLGDAPKPSNSKAVGRNVSIYDVEFAHGERLCAVDKERGVASGIVCA
jgi:hypothetical protein